MRRRCRCRWLSSWSLLPTIVVMRVLMFMCMPSHAEMLCAACQGVSRTPMLRRSVAMRVHVCNCAAALSHARSLRASQAFAPFSSLTILNFFLLGPRFDSMSLCIPTRRVAGARRGRCRLSRWLPALIWHAARQQGMPQCMGNTCGTPQTLSLSKFMVCARLM